MWGNFNSRFQSILDDLKYHGKLIDKEASAVNIAEAADWRRQHLEQQSKMEQDRKASQRYRTMTWLRSEDVSQEDEIDRISRDCLPGSCDWLIQHPETERWLKEGAANALIWLHGKPGAGKPLHGGILTPTDQSKGKSVICSSLVQFMQSKRLSVFYYFCSFRDNAVDNCTRLHLSLVAQIIQKNLDLVPYIYNEYVLSHPKASQKALKGLLPNLLASVGSSRLVIDGMDEWDPKEQELIIEAILPLISADVSHICKILISSRDVPAISRSLQKKTKSAITISLADEHRAIDHAIECFIQKRFSAYESDKLDPDGAILPGIQRVLVKKSNGKNFLWLKFIVLSLCMA